LADAAVTTGASAVVEDTVIYGTAFKLKGRSLTGTATNTTSPPSVTFDNKRVGNAQYGHNLKESGTLLAATIPVDMTFSSGVFSAPSLATTASITITLQGTNNPNEEWIVNITDILSFNVSTIIKLVVVHDDSRIIWNLGGYISVGSDAKIYGTILAHTYIITGDGSVLMNNYQWCGGLYSATSYVSIGASSEVSYPDCMTESIAPKEAGSPRISMAEVPLSP
jgi:hypothetical protein